MHLFYTPDITTNEYTLPEEESKHCVKVLRLEIGDEIFLVDGKGGFYRCEIIQAHRNAVKLAVLKKQRSMGNGLTAFILPLPRQKISNASNGSWKNARRSGLTKLHPYSAITRNAR
ncbi:MAG: RNA methyltransferase PUA domain-containing protein [Butyricimonas faecihominis]